MGSVSTISFVLIFFSGIISSLCLDPIFGACVYMFDYFMNPRSRWWFQGLPDLRYSYIAMMSLFAGYIVRSKNYSIKRIFQVPQTKWLISQTILLIALTLIAVDSVNHNILLIRYLKYVIFSLFLLIIVDSKEKLEKIIGVFIVGCCYTGFYGWQVGRTGGGRLERVGPADSPDSNGTAAVVLCAVPLLFYYLLEGKRWQKIASLG